MDEDHWLQGLMASKHHLGVSTIAISQIHEEIRDMLSAASKNVDASFLAVEQGPGEDGIGEIENREEEIDLATVSYTHLGFLVGATPSKLLTSSNSGFAMMIPMALAVSMEDPPPMAIR